MRIDITAHPAEDITLDLAGVRELQAENARLTAELAEARKQPVRVLPEITDAMLTIEFFSEWYKPEYSGADGERARAANAVLARHFRQADAPKPALDVEAVAREAREHYLNTPDNMNESVVKVLRRHCTDAPAQPLQKMQQFAPADETLAAAVARVERETRAKCAEMVMDWNPCNETRRMLADRMERGG